MVTVLRLLRLPPGGWVIAALSLQAAFAQAGPAAPACPDQPIRVGLYELGPFHSMPRGAKQGAGLDRDIVDELQKRSGCSFTFEPMVRARIWIELRAGRLDMTLSALHSDDRASFSWLHPVMQLQSLTLLPRELLPEAGSRSAFIAHPGWMLGVVRGYQHQAADQAQRWRRLTDQISRNGTMERLLLRYVPPAEARSMLLPTPHLARNP